MAKLLYGSLAYLGEYAGTGAIGDALALTFLQARKWDSLGTGLGTAQEGHWYVNTTDHRQRRYLDGAWRAGVISTDVMTPIAHTHPVADLSDAGTKGREVAQAADSITVRDAIKVRLDYESTTDPGVTNDEADTAAIGTEFSIGDTWQRTNVSPVRWYKADSVAVGAAVWTQFNPATFATAAQGLLAASALQAGEAEAEVAAAGIAGQALTPDGAGRITSFAVPAGHTQGTDQTVDLGGANETSAAEIRAGVDLAGTALQSVSLAALITEAKYRVSGGAVVHDGTRFLQGLSDTMLTTIDTDIWDSDSIPDPATMTITAGASGTTFDATAAAATGQIDSIHTLPDKLKHVPIWIRWHSTFTNYGNETKASLELYDGTTLLGIIHRRQAATTLISWRNGGFGTSASPGDACWICSYYNPVSGMFRSWYNTTFTAAQNPGWPMAATSWVAVEAGTTISPLLRGAIVIRRSLYQNHAGQATAIFRGADDGFLLLGS